MSTILTKAAYARLREVDPSAVSQWIKRGKLRAPALTPDGRIVVAEADQQLREELDLSRSLSRGGPRSLLDAPETGVADNSPNPPRSEDPARAKARVALEIAELDRDEKRRRADLQRGVYIAADQVRAERGRALQQMLAAIDGWLGADLPAALGLDQAVAVRLRQEWRRFRQRQAETATDTAARLPALLPEPERVSAHAA
jgi:hypothetical protein